MTRLRYSPGPDDPEPFHDEERHHKYWPSVHEIDDLDVVEEYLELEAWERVDDEASDASDSDSEIQTPGGLSTPGAETESQSTDARVQDDDDSPPEEPTYSVQMGAGNVDESSDAERDDRADTEADDGPGGFADSEAGDGPGGLVDGAESDFVPEEEVAESDQEKAPEDDAASVADKLNEADDAPDPEDVEESDGDESNADVDADAADESAGETPDVNEDEHTAAVVALLEQYEPRSDSVSEFLSRVGEVNLSADEYQQLIDYERAHKDRETAIEPLREMRDNADE